MQREDGSAAAREALEGRTAGCREVAGPGGLVVGGRGPGGPVGGGWGPGGLGIGALGPGGLGGGAPGSGGHGRSALVPGGLGGGGWTLPVPGGGSPLVGSGGGMGEVGAGGWRPNMINPGLGNENFSQIKKRKKKNTKGKEGEDKI